MVHDIVKCTVLAVYLEQVENVPNQHSNMARLDCPKVSQSSGLALERFGVSCLWSLTM